MHTASELQTGRVAEAFDGVARVFESSLENDITRAIRRKVYSAIASLVPAGSSILDINCGIGIDAVELARQGYLLSGADISSEMVRMARQRAHERQITNSTFVQTSFEDLSPFYGKTYDLILSNFGGLNCVSSLQQAARQVARVTKPGGYFVAIVMPPFSLWEFASGIARFNPGLAFRRLRKGTAATGFGPATFTVSYFSPRKFAKAFQSDFQVIGLRGLNIITPPPHATTFAAHFAKLGRFLERWEHWLAGLPLFRSAGDHYIITLQRRSLSHPDR